MIGEASVSGKYSCLAQNEEGTSIMMIPFYIDGKWVTRILQLKYQHLNLGYFYCNNCKAQYTVHQTLSNDLQIQYTPCNELQELGRNAQIVLCNKETRGGGH